MGAARPTLAPPAGYHRTVFSTHDAAEAHDYACRTYSDTDLAPVGDQRRFELRDEQADLESFGTIDFSHTSGMELSGEPLGRLLVARVTAGRWRCDTIGEERRLRPGDVCVVAQPDRPSLISWPDAVRVHFVSLDPTTLLDVAAAPHDLLPRFTSLTPATADGRQLVSTVLDHIVHDVAGNPAARQNPIIRQSAARTLAAALLEALPSTAVREPVAADRVDASRSRVLRSALAYLHNYAHTDVSVQDLAESARVSRQAVHLAFQQHLQVTPHAYLERIRLDRVHRDLTDLGPETTTVDDVAALWGFSGPERFRRRYRAVFDRTPEQTLQA